MYKLIFFILLSVSLYSEDSVSSINKLINNNLIFFQTTDSGFEEINSKGRLIRNKDFIEITIDFPSNEKYILRDSIIEIYDYDFNQTSIYQIDENNGHILDLIINGEEKADVKDLTNSSFSIKNGDNDILIELNEDNGFSLTYIDNMQFKNIINFQVIK